MKTKLIYTVALIMLSIGNYAQPQKNMHRIVSKEQIEARKIAYITTRIALSPAEATVFWPIYNEYQKEKQQLNREKHELAKEINIKIQTSQNAEMETLSNKMIELQKREAAIFEKYHTKYKSVLPIEKVLKLYDAEMSFKRQLLKDIKDGVVVTPSEID